jgi:hypothetical protein
MEITASNGVGMSEMLGDGREEKPPGGGGGNPNSSREESSARSQGVDAVFDPALEISTQRRRYARRSCCGRWIDT